jgi:hypothetical protein
LKIRIKSNTLRLRLSQEEVNRLVKQGDVFDICHIGNNHLAYGIRHSDDDDLTASFVGSRIIVGIPKSFLKGWDTSDKIGFETTDDGGLHILVEKDFQCLKPRQGDDESDLYPNPQAG